MNKWLQDMMNLMQDCRLKSKCLPPELFPGDYAPSVILEFGTPAGRLIVAQAAADPQAPGVSGNRPPVRMDRPEIPDLILSEQAAKLLLGQPQMERCPPGFLGTLDMVGFTVWNLGKEVNESEFTEMPIRIVSRYRLNDMPLLMLQKNPSKSTSPAGAAKLLVLRTEQSGNMQA